jgi:hypothetical protein
MSAPTLVDVRAEVLHKTQKAILIAWEGEEVWLPKSHCQDNEDGTVTVEKWLAKELV